MVKQRGEWRQGPFFSMLGFFAVRDIAPLEELTWFYARASEGREENATRCKCKSDVCLGYL